MRTSWALVLGCALAVGCGAASEPERTGEGDVVLTSGGSGGAGGAIDAAGRCTGGCEGEEAVCGGSIAWRCSCSYHADVNCGGAARAPGPGWWAWSCTPLDPRTDRGDGCPFVAPVEGEACRGDRTCRYAEGTCGWSGQDATCAGGAWHLAEFMLPPPP